MTARCAVVASVRQVVDEHGRLQQSLLTLTDRDDLFAHGMTSHASVSVMLALEERFGVEFPEALLQRRTFESITALADAITHLLAQVDAMHGADIGPFS